MTSDRARCGFSSFLPMSCRGTAEKFARSLTTKLQSLGSHSSQDENTPADENSWLGATHHDNSTSIALNQPHSDGFIYNESPGSPQEEIDQSELERLINRGNKLTLPHSEDCHCSVACKERNIPLFRGLKASSNDSDSSDGGPFYDTENETTLESRNQLQLQHHPQVQCNGLSHVTATSSTNQDLPQSSKSSKSNNLQDIDLEDSAADLTQSSSKDEFFSTSSESTLPPLGGSSSMVGGSSSLSEEVSTLSLRDDDESDPSLEVCSPLSQCDDDIEGLELLNVDDCQKQHNDIQEQQHVTRDCGVENLSDDSSSDKDTYRSSFSVDKDLTIECPNTIRTDLHETSTPSPEELASTEEKTAEETSQIQSSPSESNQISPEEEEDPSSKSSHLNTSLGQDEDEDAEDRTPRVRRCSSLKTGKTPPGTPGSKKIVRFADVLGLDLAQCRTFLDEIPKVPTSAYVDLKDADLTESSESDTSVNSNSGTVNSHGVKVDRVLIPMFQQPGGLPNCLDRVRDEFVCLENAMVDDPFTLAIKGIVRVRNLDFHKSVHIRYSLDSWQTFADLQAVYIENSCDGFSDKFSFLMYAHTLRVGQRLEFAVRFQCKGCQYWDSNKGANYCFQCLPPTNSASYTPILAGTDDGFGASFYYQEDSPNMRFVGRTLEYGPIQEEDEGAEGFEDIFTPTMVQELIARSLGKNKHHSLKQQLHHQDKPSSTIERRTSDLLTIFAVLAFSILFMYIQRAIFFAK